MKILSIQNDLDAGCALIEGDKILEVLNEERFSRIKLHEGFPHLSLKYIFKKYKLHADKIDSKVIGWFQDKMEYGPRALGGRSILFHAQDKTCNDWLNKRMNRTEFMPFGPVTPIDYANECYVGFNKNDLCTPYMTKTFKCKKLFIKDHPAVVHIDNTSRPQVVTKSRNGLYYKILKLYCKKTGYKALINTSFNAHEEPIVFTPGDAIKGLLTNMIDILYIGSYKIYKKEKKNE